MRVWVRLGSWLVRPTLRSNRQPWINRYKNDRLIAMVRCEMVSIFNGRGVAVGAMERGQAIAERQLMGNVLVFVCDSLGRLWSHKRPDNKPAFPGLRDISACGLIQAGETPAQAALREQKEEMGFISPLVEVGKPFPNTTVFNGDETTILSWAFLGVSSRLPEDTVDAVDHQRQYPMAWQKLHHRRPDQFVPSFGVEIAHVIPAYEEMTRQR